MRFSKSEIVVLASLASIKTNLCTTSWRKQKAIQNLKAKGWIYKEVDSPWLKFTDKAWQKMNALKTKINGAA